ncbi:MAG: hydrogenase/urease accessory protein HupE [Granulosicoccus sp.]|jgi:hydrogenase/urease accessory protein HupE
MSFLLHFKFILIITTVLLVFSNLARAHEIKPAIVDLNYSSDSDQPGNSELLIDIVLNVESLMADIGPDHEDTDASENAHIYKKLRAMEDGTLLSEFDSFQSRFIAGISIINSRENSLALTVKSITIPVVGDINIPRDTRITLQSTLPENTVALQWKWNKAFGEVIVRANSDSIDLDYAALLSPGQKTDLIQFTQNTEQSNWRIIGNYIVVGFDHILPKGLDHILFVIGVFLLTPVWRSLAIQVTIFTLAHSFTLALATNGVLSVSPAIVEPLIALSIVVVCVENYFTDKLSKWRLMTVFVFGLIHGLGFASVLSAVGLETQNFLVALLGFNIGVELGQLLIIAMCMLGIGMWFGKHNYYRKMFSKPASVIVGTFGAIWFFQRIASLF